MSNKPKRYRNAKSFSSQAEKRASQTKTETKKGAPTQRQSLLILLLYVLQFAGSAIVARIALGYLPVMSMFARFSGAFVVFTCVWLVLYAVVIRPLERRFHIADEKEDHFEPPTL